MHGKVCVELDASSSSDCSPQDYYDYIKLTPENNRKLDKIAKDKATMADTMFKNYGNLKLIGPKADPSNTGNSYGKGDEMMAKIDFKSYRNFMLP
jgi:hypothetical protein